MKKNKFQKGLLVFGTALMLLSSAFFVVNCADLRANIRDAEEYTRANKITLGTMIVAQTADAYTTDKGIKAGASEVNPLLGSDKPSTGTIALFSVAAVGVKWLAGHLMSQKWRNWFWGGATVINTGATINNYGVWQDMEDD